MVTSETIAKDTQNLNTIAECMDKSGKALDRKEFTEKNPYPDSQPLYSRFASVDREGVIHTEDSHGQNNVNYSSGKPLTKEEEEVILRNVQEQTRQINMQIQQQQRQFQQQMMEFQKNMQQSFGNGFPFKNGSPFNNGFPFGNNFPFYNPYNNVPQQHDYHNYNNNHN